MEAKLYFSQLGKLQTTVHHLLVKCYSMKINCCVFGGNEEIEELNKKLWLSPKNKFLPHSIIDENDNSLQPILLIPTTKKLEGSLSFAKFIYVVSSETAIELPKSPIGDSTLIYTALTEPYETHKNILIQWSKEGSQVIQCVQNINWTGFEKPNWIT